jgi:nitric oxide reductase subunit B
MRRRQGLEEVPMATGARRGFLISKGWIQAVVLVVLFGFFVLGLLAYRTYIAHPPVPGRVVESNGNVLFTGSEISKGQRVFLHNGLIKIGSLIQDARTPPTFPLWPRRP